MKRTTKYVALDVHQASTVFSVREEGGRVIARAVVPCRFLEGHRIRLEITSSDFPNHDRNHNTGRNDLADTELVSARQTLYHTSEYPSRLILPVDSQTG